MTLVFCGDRVRRYLDDHKAKASQRVRMDHSTNSITFLTVICGDKIYLLLLADTPENRTSIPVVYSLKKMYVIASTDKERWI